MLKNTPSRQQDVHCWLPESIITTRSGRVGTCSIVELWLWSTSINNSFLAHGGVVIKYQHDIKITGFLKYTAKRITIRSVLEILAVMSSSVLSLSVCTFFPLMMVHHSAETCGDVIEIFY
jgi:hypothetical protein